MRPLGPFLIRRGHRRASVFSLANGRRARFASLGAFNVTRFRWKGAARCGASFLITKVAPLVRSDGELLRGGFLSVRRHVVSQRAGAGLFTSGTARESGNRGIGESIRAERDKRVAFSFHANAERREREMRPTFARHDDGVTRTAGAVFNHPASEWPTPARLARYLRTVFFVYHYFPAAARGA